VRIRGTITKWNEKGFGFITPADGGKQVFVHVRAFSGGNQRPAAGMKVTCEVAQDPEGRLSAENAAIAGIRLMPGPASRAFIVGAVILSLVGYAATLGALPAFLFWLFLGTSVLAFGLYKLDKSAARNEGQRTPESTLHIVALLGGWPGALYAQQLLRHKSRKTSFQVVFWLTVMANAGLLIYIVTPHGAWLAAVLDQQVTRGAALLWELRSKLGF
jgi:uncharacterized membrane protein YsdA (DUF1294 family)/cold shock CspA family protein